MKPVKPVPELNAEQRQEIAAWIEANGADLPESVRTFLEIHKQYLGVAGDPKKALEAALRELRRALHITPSSEKRRSSGAPLSNLPKVSAEDKKHLLEAELDRGKKLSDWHRKLKKRHDKRTSRIQEILRNMAASKGPKSPEPIRLEDIELTPEEIAESEKNAEDFVEKLQMGGDTDPTLASVEEALMKSGGVVVKDRKEPLSAEVPRELADATVIKTLHETRVRYDFSMQLTRIELEVEKKVLVDQTGERSVIAASTLEYGPPRYSVTWEALGTLAILVGQFAIPFHRLGTMLSTPEKKFTTSALSRMLHYVAERLVPIYLELAKQLSHAEILAADDTSCRILEVSKFADDLKEDRNTRAPWSRYRDRATAQKTLEELADQRAARIRRREEGDRTAKPTEAEIPPIGVLIARELGFESPLKSGEGPKQAMHVSVVSGRSIADDPKSYIVFYRSHLGSSGNLLETILRHRDKKNSKLTLQTDMSTTNLVTNPEIRKHLTITTIGCLSHARRPFAIYEDEDPEHCESMLHLMLGIYLHEQQLDAVGRNRENVLAVRKSHSRPLWGDILDLAQSMAKRWSKATNLGTAARYIITHFEELTRYLEDPRLEPTNNLSERMLRMEKLIEGSSMFRKSLEGRFVLDVVRTILQTAVAAGVSPQEYLVSVLRANEQEIKAYPEKFTPHVWAEANRVKNSTANPPSDPATPPAVS